MLQDDNLSEEKRKHYLTIIETETTRLSKLSQNLLKLTLLESGRVYTRKSELSIRSTVKANCVK